MEQEAKTNTKEIIARLAELQDDMNYIKAHMVDVDPILTSEEGITLKRVLNRDHTHKETKKDVLKRKRGIVDKFKILYGHDKILDRNYFDLEIDTSNINVKEVTKIALQNFKLHQFKRDNK